MMYTFNYEKLTRTAIYIFWLKPNEQKNHHAVSISMERQNMVYVQLFSDFHMYFQMLKSTFITEEKNFGKQMTIMIFVAKKCREH